MTGRFMLAIASFLTAFFLVGCGAGDDQEASEMPAVTLVDQQGETTPTTVTTIEAESSTTASTASSNASSTEGATTVPAELSAAEQNGQINVETAEYISAEERDCYKTEFRKLPTGTYLSALKGTEFENDIEMAQLAANDDETVGEASKYLAIEECLTEDHKFILFTRTWQIELSDFACAWPHQLRFATLIVEGERPSELIASPTGQEILEAQELCIG